MEDIPTEEEFESLLQNLLKSFDVGAPYWNNLHERVMETFRTLKADSDTLRDLPDQIDLNFSLWSSRIRKAKDLRLAMYILGCFYQGAIKKWKKKADYWRKEYFKRNQY